MEKQRAVFRTPGLAAHVRQGRRLFADALFNCFSGRNSTIFRLLSILRLQLQLLRGLRVVCYAFLGLLTMELAARLDDLHRYGASMTAPYSIERLFQPSPFGREGKPGARFTKWSMNSLGFRGPEIVAGRSNIVVFGASETFGVYESPDAEYPRQLEAELNAERPAHDQYNVINVALPGMRIGRVGYLDRAIEVTNAKYVVIYPTPANYIGTTAPLCTQTTVPVPDSLGMADYIRLAGKLRQVAKEHAPSGVMTTLRKFSIWVHTRDIDVMEHVPEASIDAFRADLICVTELARSRGAEPVLLTHATYFGSEIMPGDEEMMIAWRRFYPGLSEAGFIDLEKRANDAIRSIGHDAAVNVVDSARLIPRGPEYFADFVHFTDQGAARMATLISEQITATYAAPRDSWVRSTTRAPTASRID